MNLSSQDPWENREFVAPLLHLSASPLQQPGGSLGEASTESELLDRMCEQSDNSAQISDRLERLLTSMEAQTNDRTAWAGWMSIAMGKILEEPLANLPNEEFGPPQPDCQKIQAVGTEGRPEAGAGQGEAAGQQTEAAGQQAEAVGQYAAAGEAAAATAAAATYIPTAAATAVHCYTDASSTHTSTRSCGLLYSSASSFSHPGSDHCHFPDSISAHTSGQSAGSSSGGSGTKFVITDTEGRTIGLSDLNLSDLNASFVGISNVPSTPMTPITLINQDDSQGF